MNSKKVKEIKECLNREVEEFQSEFCQDILTLINELEEENKDYKDRCELIHDLGFDYDGSKTIEDFKILVDELVLVAINGAQVKKEKGNERLANVTPYQVVISDDKFEELKKNAVEDFNLTKIMLKQFAERLKEKMNEGEYMGKKYKLSVFRDIDIDETLKEFVNKKRVGF